jgi:hypothetical protein
MEITFSPSQAVQFRGAHPFSHIVLDDLIDPLVLAQVEREFPSLDRAPWIRMKNEWEHKLACEQPRFWGRTTRVVMLYLNSGGFVRELEKLTGIPGLISDPTYRGGGLHGIPPGGYLKIHTDFNEHNGAYRGQGWYRQLNLVLFLNSDWREEWGGHFELWDEKGHGAVARVSPLFNRTVIFLTSEKSLHGHPGPLRCPSHRIRKSLALYYYSRTKPNSATSCGTVFFPS